MLHVDFLTQLPSALLDCAPKDIRKVLPHPSVIELEGTSGRPLLVSFLLHGNEISGLLIVQKLLKQFGEKLPRPVILFAGNVQAAEVGMRRLDSQPDFNRIWKRDAEGKSGEILNYFRKRNPVAAIDLHNNSGKNPIYSCVANTEDTTLAFASHFSEHILHFRTCDTTLSAAMSHSCPSVTLECGTPGNSHGIEAAFQFLTRALDRTMDTAPLSAQAYSLYQTVGQLVIPEDCGFHFLHEPSESSDLGLDGNLDEYNFKPCAAGLTLASRLSPQGKILLIDDSGREITDEILDHLPDKVVLKKSLVPAMLTTNSKIIRQDCLGYLLEKVKGFPK